MARSHRRYLIAYENGSTEKVYAYTVRDALEKIEGDADEVHSIICYGFIDGDWDTY